MRGVWSARALAAKIDVSEKATTARARPSLSRGNAAHTNKPVTRLNRSAVVGRGRVGRARRAAHPSVGTETFPALIVTTADPRLGTNESVEVDTWSSSVSPAGRS